MRVLVEVSGAGETPLRPDSPETLGDLALLHEARVYASAGRIEEAMATSSIGGLITVDQSKWVDDHIQAIVVAAESYERNRAAHLGLTPEVLWGVTRAYAELEGGIVRTDTDWCRELHRTKAEMASFRVQQFAEGQEDPDWITRQLWSVVASPRDLGCLVGVPGRFASAEEVYAHIHSAPERVVRGKEEDCAKAFLVMKEHYDPVQIVSESPPGQMNATQATIALDAYYSILVLPLCVTD